MAGGDRSAQLSDADITSFLAPFEAETQRLARASLAALRHVFPDALESAEGGEIGLGFGPGYRGLVFTVSPQRTYVNVGIAGGANLDDPDGLLEGTGKVHRHLKIRSVDQLADERVQALFRRALVTRRNA